MILIWMANRLHIKWTKFRKISIQQLMLLSFVILSKNIKKRTNIINLQVLASAPKQGNSENIVHGNGAPQVLSFSYATIPRLTYFLQ